MVRLVRPGGIVAVYVWDYAGKMRLMRDFWDAATAEPLTAAIIAGSATRGVHSCPQSVRGSTGSAGSATGPPDADCQL